jgi:hypothetical protein
LRGFPDVLEFSKSRTISMIVHQKRQVLERAKSGKKNSHKFVAPILNSATLHNKGLCERC